MILDSLRSDARNHSAHVSSAVVKSFLAVFLLATPLLGAGKSDRWVEKTLRSMSLDEKIGQMLMPGSSLGAFRNIDAPELQNVRRDIVDYHVAGVHVFGGDPAVVA